MSLIRIARSVLVGSILLLLSHGEAAAPLKSTDGVVVFKVIPNRPGAATFFKNWNNITVRQVDAKGAKTFSLKYEDKGNTRTAVYSGALPAGRYRFVEFASFQCGWMCIKSTIEVNEKFLQFSIESGKLTYLGNIIQLLKEADETLLIPQLHPSVSDATNIVNAVYPQFSGLLASGVLGWADVNPSEQDAIYKKAKLLSAGLFSPVDALDGSILFGSSLGVVRRWTPGGAMTPIDTGASVSIEAVIELSEGVLLAGGELGTLMVSNDAGATWSNLDVGIPFGVVKSLKITANGDVYLTHLSGNIVSIFKGRVDESPWKRITEQTLSFSAMWDIGGVLPETFKYMDYLITTLPGRNLLVLNTRDDTFEIRKTAGGIQSLTITADGVIRCRCVVGIIVNPWESRDFGLSWTKSPFDRFMLLPTFNDQNVGIAMLGAWLSKDSYLAASSDGGKTWDKKFSTDGKFYPNIFYSARNGFFAAFDNYDALMYSSDNGNSWKAGY